MSVSPNPIPYGVYPSVTIRTSPHAVCGIKVIYSTGNQPTAYLEHSSTADGTGTVTEGASGTCMYGRSAACGKRQQPDLRKQILMNF